MFYPESSEVKTRELTVKSRVSLTAEAMLIFMALSILFTVIILAFARLFSIINATLAPPVIILLNSIAYLAAAILTVVFFEKIHGGNTAYKPIAKLDGLSMSLMTLAIVGGLSLSYRILSPLSFFEGSSLDAVNSEGSLYFVQLLLTSSLIPAVAEELIFRGLVLKTLLPLGKVFSICVSSVIFALAHGSVDNLLYIFAAGVLIGFLYAETGSLVCCISAHFANNLVTVAEIAIVTYLPSNKAGQICLAIDILLILIGTLAALLLIFTHRKTYRVLPMDSGKELYSVTEYAKALISPVFLAYLLCVLLTEFIFS